MASKSSNININLKIQEQTSSASSKLSKGLLSVSNNSNKANASVRKLTSGLKSMGAASTGVKSLSTSFVSLTAGLKAFVAVKLTQYFSDIVTTATDAVETLNLFSVAMGDLANSTNDLLTSLSESSGLDITSLMGTTAEYNLLARSMGVASDKAQILSTTSSQLAIDLASLTNRNVSDVADDLRSGLVGQSETMYKYGVDITEAALQQEALNQGITKTVSNMTQAEKVQLRYAVILRQTSLAQGDFANTVNQPANQIRILQERLLTLSRSIGSIFVPALTAILPLLNAIVQGLTEITDKLAEMAGYTSTSVENTTDNFTGLGDEADSATDSVDSLSESIKGLASFDELNIIGSTTDTTATDTSSDAYIDVGSYDSGITSIRQKSEEYLAFMKQGLKDLRDLWLSAFPNLFPNVNFSSVADNVASIVNSLKTIGSTLYGEFKNVAPSLKELITTTAISVYDVFGVFTELFIAAVADALSNLTQPFKNWSESVSGNLISAFSSNSSTISTIHDLLINAIGSTEDESVAVMSGFMQNAVNFGLTLSNVFVSAYAAASTAIDDFVAGNKGKIETFFTDIIEVGNSCIGLFNTIIADLIGIFDGFWSKWGEQSVNTITTILLEQFAIVMDIFSNILKPILDSLFESIRAVWDSGLSDAFVQLGDTLGALIALLGDMWSTILQPLLSWIVSAFGPYIVNTFETIFSVASSVLSGIARVVGGILSVFEGFFQILSGLLNDNSDLMRQGFINMFSGIGSIVAGVLSSIANVFVSAINGIIGVINTVGSEFPNYVKMSKLEKVNISIPALASGGILDAGQAFIAGEAGAELIGSYNNKATVMPLENTSFVSAMQNAVAQGVSAAMSGITGGEQSIQVNVGGKTLVDEVISGVNRKIKQTSTNVFNV